MSASGTRGSVKQDANGTWRYVADLPTVDGKRKQAYKRGFTTKKLAQAALAELLRDVDRGTYVPATSMTYREWVEGHWLPDAKSQLRPSTLHSYERNLRLHVLPDIGSVKLQDLKGVRLSRLYRELQATGMKGAGKAAAGLSPRTVRYVHTIIGASLKAAVKAEILVANPAARAEPPKASASADGTTPMRTWTLPQLGAFLTAERGERLHPLWLLLATTGLRRGEALGLSWANVDLDAGRVAVRRTLVDLDGLEPVWSDPKTAKGKRSVPLDATTVATLKALRVAQAEERLLVGAGYAQHDLVFARPDGMPYHPERTSRVFQSRVRRHKLPVIRVHDLRHTWATLALGAGIHPKVVQERLGHANISITLDTYSHATETMQAEAAERVAGLIFGGIA